MTNKRASIFGFLLAFAALSLRGIQRLTKLLAMPGSGPFLAGA
jgi:hypothetical protein